MAQYLRPDADVTTTNIQSGDYTDIDESTADDSDFILTKQITTTTVYECSLSNPSGTPGAGTTIFRYRGRWASGSKRPSVTAELYQGATLIDADAAFSIPMANTTRAFTPDTSSVSDWNDLRCRFTFTQTGSGTDSRARLTWVELEAPSAGYTLTADAASFTLTGTAATLLLGLVLAAAGGSFALTGGDVEFIRSEFLDAEPASFALTATAAELVYFNLDASAGAFALTGTAPVLAYGYNMAAGAGTFTLTGGDTLRDYYPTAVATSPSGWVTTILT